MTANQINRRKALTVVATAPAALALGSGAALADAGDAAVRELWRRLIECERGCSAVSTAEDEATWNARKDIEALDAPWRPRKEGRLNCTDELENGQRKLTFIDTEPTMFQDGVWHVWEGQINSHHPEQCGSAERWQPYPEAKDGEEAYRMSEARAAKDLRSFAAKRAAISRKHGVRKAKKALEDAHEASSSIRSTIAKAPVTCAAAIAVKLAMYLDGGSAPADADPDGTFDEIEAAGIESIYRHAVAECGFDPLAELGHARAFA